MDEPVKVSGGDEVKEKPNEGSGQQTEDDVKDDGKSASNESVKLRRFLLKPRARPPAEKLEDLDDYSLTAVLERLCIKDRFRLMRVNSRWYRVIHESFARTKALIFRDSFSLWDREVLTAKILASILKRCPLVEYLDLCQTGTTLDDKICSIIRRRCPRLKRLVCRDADLKKNAVTSVGKACPNLEVVDFGKCKNVTEKSLWRLLNLLPRLLEISLVNCNMVTGRCLYLCRNLQHINLSGCFCFLSSSFVRLGQNCSGTLRTLIAPPISPTALEVICRTFPNLVHFEVDSPAAGFGSLNGARLLGSLCNLRTLIFRPILHDLDDHSFAYITANLPHLTELYLFGTDYVTDQSVGRLAENCPNMRILNLEGFKFCDRTLRTFTRLNNLEQLIVAGSLISDEGAYYIMSNLPKLELLGVNSCPGISLEVLSNAYDLVTEGMANKNLIICYNNIRIRVSDFRSKLEIRNYEPSEIWGSMDFDVGLQQQPDDFNGDHDDGVDYDDDVIFDGDLDDFEEELT